MGANDVVIPAARTDKNSPIFGMPIIDADKPRCLRSSAARIADSPADNDLYFADRTRILFGDAKAVFGELVKQLAQGLGIGNTGARVLPASR